MKIKCQTNQVCNRLFSILPVLLALAGVLQPAACRAASQYAAGTFTWDNGITSAWSPVSGGPYTSPWTSGNDAVLEGTAGTVTIAGPTVHNLTISTTGYALSGAGTLALSGASPTFSVGSGLAASIGSATATVIGGNTGLTLGGPGTLTLNSSAVNTFTGGFNVLGGTNTLDFSNLATPTGLINSGNVLTIGGSTLNILGKNAASATSSQTFASTTLNPGNVGNIIVPNKGSSATSLTLNLGQITANPGGVTTFLPNTAWSTTASTTEIVKLAAGGGITLPGSGSVPARSEIFCGTSTSTRWAFVNSSGQLLGAPTATVLTATPSGSNPTTVNSITGGATLAGALTGFGLIPNATSAFTLALGANNYTLNGIIAINSGTMTMSATSGNIVIGPNQDFVVNCTSTSGVNINAPIVDNGSGASALTLCSSSSGTLTLAGPNTYSGVTTVTKGAMTLNTTNANAIPGNLNIGGGGVTLTQSNQIADTATVTLNNPAAKFALNGMSEAVANVNVISASTTTSLGLATGVGGKLTVSGALTVLAGSVTLNSPGAGLSSSITANSLTNLGGTWIFGTNSGTQTVTIGAGGLTIGNGSTMAVAASPVTAPSNSFTLGGDVTSLASTNSNTINGISGGLVFLNGVRTFNVAPSSAATNLNISAVVADGTPAGGVTKTGNGTLTLSSPVGNTYTGPTVVNAGALGVSLPMLSSSLTLTNGSTLAVTVNNSGWTNSAMTLSNNTINLAFGLVAGQPTAVFATSLLKAGGSNVVNIVSGAGLPLGQTTLIDYSSGTRVGSGTFALGTLPPGVQATLTDGPTAVTLNVTLSVQILLWSAGNADWATNGLLNWNVGTAAYQEYSSGFGDQVIFDDTAGSAYTVNVPDGVHPFSMTVNLTNSAATIGGAGQINGAAVLTKNGAGTLTLSSPNSYYGGTLVNAGTIQVINGGALGSTAGGTVVAGGATVTVGDGFGTGATVTNQSITINGAGVGGALGALRGAGDAGPNIWKGPIIIGANGTRIGTEINGSLTVSGSITDNGAGYGLWFRPGANGVVTIASSGNTYGTTTIYGDNSGTGSILLGANNALSTNELLMAYGTLNLNGFNQLFAGLGNGTGTGTILNNGAVPSTLSVNTLTNSYSFASSLQDGSQPLSLLILGSGKQTLTANNSYSGGTTVAGGTLALTLPMNSSSLTLASNSTLSLTVAGSSWSPAVMNTTNSILNLNYGTLFGVPSPVFSTTALNVSGSNVVNITATNLPAAVIPLISYTSESGGGGFYVGALPTNVVATIVDTGSAIVLNVTFSPQNLTWSGVNTGTWNTNGTYDWNSGASAYQEYANGLGDFVAFDDTASVFMVAVTNNVHPYSMTVSNGANAYTFDGPGAIEGPTGLTKTGTNVLLLASANSYTGNTTINGGTVSFTNGGLGSGPIVVNTGATLQWAPGNSQDISSRLRLNGSNLNSLDTLDLQTNNVVFNSSIGLNTAGNETTNEVGKIGSGTLTLANGTSTLGSVVRINGGTLVVNSGATLTMDGAGTVANAALVADNNGTIVVNGGIINVGDRLGMGSTGSSTGMVTVASGALNVEVASTTSTRGIRLVGGSSSAANNNQGTLNLNGGTLTVAGFYIGLGTNNISIFNFNGGTLRPSTNVFAGTFMTGLTHAYVQAGGALIDTRGDNLMIGQGLESGGGIDGGLTKWGAGTLTLSGTNSYTGPTTVSNGTLNVTGILGVGPVTLAGGTLGGSNTIGGAVTVNPAGTLAPGLYSGNLTSLTISSNLNLSGTAFMQLGFTGGSIPAADQVVGLNNVTYGGSLVVSNTSAITLAAGQSFQLFAAAAGSANFTNITLLGTGSAGLLATFNPATGQLTLGSATLPQPLINQVTMAGGNLILQGTNGALSGTYSILTSTNVALPLSSWSTNLSGVFTGSGAFSNAIPIGSGPQVFFLLKQP